MSERYEHVLIDSANSLSKKAAFLSEECALFKQSILLDLLQHLRPEEGEFWYLENHAAEACVTAGEVVEKWHKNTSRNPLQSPLQRLPLWMASRTFLARGERLTTSGLAWWALSTLCDGRVAMRWVLSHPNVKKAAGFNAVLENWSEHRVELLDQSSKHRLYQVVGKSYEALQELAYLGGARAPGIAVLEPCDHEEDFSSLMFLLETLLMRRFWVVLTLERNPKSKKCLSPVSYEYLRRGIEAFQLPGLRFFLQSPHGSQDSVDSEIWVLSPGESFARFQTKAWEHLQSLFGGGLGWNTDINGSVSGLKMDSLPFHEPSEIECFRTRFPFKIEQDVSIDRCRSVELEEIISLWERLMDEHADFDSHFLRRPLARLYLRRSFRSYLAQPDYLLLVLRSKERVVGFISAQVVRAPLFQESRVGQVVDVYLLPEWRGKGYGQSLVKEVSQWLSSMGVKQVDLNVAIGNYRGRAFWKKQGFEPYLSVISKILSD